MELNFKMIIVIVFLMILVVLLVIIFRAMKDALVNNEWPGNVSKCPDYWMEDMSSDDIICSNEKNIVIDTCPKAVNMSTYIYNSKILATSDCAKAQWARSCDLTWDGVTNKKNVCT